jgi:nucleotide-binding universal stress UspA family protein
VYTKVVVPLDGSKTAENALPIARSFARALHIPVELLAVIDVAHMARQISADQASTLRTLSQDRARYYEQYLAGVGKNFPGDSVRHTVLNGAPAEIIIDTAAKDARTLIAMATHGRSGVDRWLLGSIAEKVIRGASNHVLLVRASETSPHWDMPSVKTIIVPLDGSKLAEEALPAAQVLANRLQATTILLGVYAGPYSGGSGDSFFSSRQVEAFIAELRAESLSYLERKTEELKRNGFDNVSLTAREGLAPDEIIRFAAETPDSLVAMCTHGRSGVQRWVLGSVTEAVVRHSDRPVLVIRAQK